MPSWMQERPSCATVPSHASFPIDRFVCLLVHTYSLVCPWTVISARYAATSMIQKSGSPLSVSSREPHSPTCQPTSSARSASPRRASSSSTSRQAPSSPTGPLKRHDDGRRLPNRSDVGVTSLSSILFSTQRAVSAFVYQLRHVGGESAPEQLLSRTLLHVQPCEPDRRSAHIPSAEPR